MSLSKSFADPNAKLVADASIVINLNATGRAADILKALPNRIVISDNTIVELDLGTRNGHDDARQLQTLIDAGVIDRVELGAKGLTIYETLVDGSVVTTLDDGEAATIALADEHGAVALLDERKARTICTKLFPDLQLGCTAQLLMHDSVAKALNSDHVPTIARALQIGRMRVPPEFLDVVVKLIGSDIAASCPSLPRSMRTLTQRV